MQLLHASPIPFIPQPIYNTWFEEQRIILELYSAFLSSWGVTPYGTAGIYRVSQDNHFPPEYVCKFIQDYIKSRAREGLFMLSAAPNKKFRSTIILINKINIVVFVNGVAGLFVRYDDVEKN
jgi:hypothetical protein